MPYAFFYDVPGNEQLYRRVQSEIGDEAPKGLIVHLVVKQDDGLRHFNVWDSPEDWERFRTERVDPAVSKVLDAIGITPPGRPEEHILDVVDVATTAANG